MVHRAGFEPATHGNMKTYYSPLLFQLSYRWLRVPVRLELTTLHLLGVRSKPTELWDLLLEEIDKKKWHRHRESNPDLVGESDES